jgi:uncharacterized protein YjbI with pentapeptide repeats
LPLFVAVAGAVSGGLLLVFIGYSIITRTLHAQSGVPPQRIDILKTALTAVAGVGGAVALVVAYRRQRDLEQGRFIERFGAAATQLGSPDPAVRIAGVYAIASAADESSTFGRRQQCIDVLCGYLRLPYDPRRGDTHDTEIVTTDRPPANSVLQSGRETTLHQKIRQNDREVRQTIVRVIGAHLQDSVDPSWSIHNYDFTGVIFEDASFLGAVFSGQNTDFRGAVFGGKNTGFGETVFRGKNADFRGAVFGGERTNFGGAVFSGTSASFNEATFSGKTYFTGTKFKSAIDFTFAKFSGETKFDHAVFSGETGFTGTKFSGETQFEDAMFCGAVTHFEVAQFSGSTNFGGATFRGTDVRFQLATFSGATTWFGGATFSAEKTNFGSVTFGSEFTTFTGAAFTGKSAVFNGAKFTGKDGVWFERPRAWNKVSFDWDRRVETGGENATEQTIQPAFVFPSQWPPEVATD